MKQTKKVTSKINFWATAALLILLSAFLLFHLLIILRVVPFNLIWGGKIKDLSQMLLLEAVSVIVTIVMIIIISINAGVVKSRMSPTIIKTSILIMFVIFVLNTIGNFTSENQFEKNVFTPFTILLSLLCFILLLNNKRISDT